MESITECLMDESMYGRVQDFNDEYVDTPFDEFEAWNMKCVNELSPKDLEWLNGLCDRINVGGRIKMVDHEDCGVWTAICIYFDKNKNICIVHPR
jgi:hypothetical protein